jgi:hypothetical protein
MFQSGCRNRCTGIRDREFEVSRAATGAHADWLIRGALAKCIAWNSRRAKQSPLHAAVIKYQVFQPPGRIHHGEIQEDFS